MIKKIFFTVIILAAINFNISAQDSTVVKLKVAKEKVKKPKGGTAAKTTPKISTAATTTKPKWVRPKVEGPLKIGIKIVPGYRLQVLTTTDRNAAIAMKSKMYNMFPNEQVYMQIKLPYYAVHQGNYLKKEDAKKARARVANALKTSVYIIGADVAVRYYPQLEPPPSNESTVRKKNTIYSYGGKNDGTLNSLNGADGKKLKKKRKVATKKAKAVTSAAPIGSTPTIKF